MGMLGCFQDVPLKAEEKEISTFIIAERDQKQESPSQISSRDATSLEDEFYGGAMLYKRRARDLPLAIQSLMAAPQQENVWEATTCLFSTPNSSSDNNSFLETNVFYKELLEKFMEFGQQVKTNFLCLTLCPYEYQRIRDKGFWPCILEIKPEESPDGLFHGILSLSKDPDLPRKKKSLSSLRTVRKAA